MSAYPDEIVIEAGRGARRYWSDLWLYRELLYFLAWRDIVVRYKQTAIGVAWALIQPLLLMVILTFVFGRLAKLPSDGIPSLFVAGTLRTAAVVFLLAGIQQRVQQPHWQCEHGLQDLFSPDAHPAQCGSGVSG